MKRLLPPLCLLVSALTGVAQELTLGHQANFSTAYAVEKPIPVFDNGYLITQESVAPIITLFDRNGTSGPRLTLSLPDDSTIHPTSYAVTAKGEPLISGFAGVSYFIAKGDPQTGKLSDPIRTDQFMSTQICEDGEGNIWSIGNQRDPKERTYDQLRQYSFDKGMLRSLLSTKELSVSPRSRSTYLRCAGKTIGVYSGSSAEWFVVEASSGDLKRYKVDLPSLGGLKFSGFALIDKTAYAGLTDDPMGDHPTIYSLAKLDCNNDKKTCKWLVIEGTAHNSKEPGPYRLLGADKDELVYSVGHFDFQWAKPQ